MKKFISIFLAALILCTGFAACSKDESVNENSESSTVAPIIRPVIKENREVEKIKAADGKVSYILDITLPKITENVSEDVINLIDYYYSEMRNEAIRSAQANAENARNYMKNNSDGKTPWQRTITFETVYSSEKYLSIEITDHFTMLGGQTTPTVSATLFDLENGSALSLTEIAKVDEETLKETVVPLMIRKTVDKFYSDGMELDEDQQQAVADSFNPYSFCYSSRGITVYINKNLVDQSYSGTFCCELTFSDLRNVISRLDANTSQTEK